MFKVLIDQTFTGCEPYFRFRFRTMPEKNLDCLSSAIRFAKNRINDYKVESQNSVLQLADWFLNMAMLFDFYSHHFEPTAVMFIGLTTYSPTYNKYMQIFAAPTLLC